MQVLIRTDASVAIGSGHVMRCLTLADGLREKGATVSFVCRQAPGHLCDVIAAAGFVVHRLPVADSSAQWRDDATQTAAAMGKGAAVDWLIVDHYGLDRSWESAMRPSARNILVIDDLADRAHACDVLLDQNYCTDLDRRYDSLVPDSCTKLLGPRFALLRSEFVSARPDAPRDVAVVRRVLVFLSGADPANVTGRVLAALDAVAEPEVEVDIVVGANGRHIDVLTAYCAKLPGRRLHVQTARMAALLAEADVAIGGGGSTSWERACLGVPSLVIGLAQNQLAIAEALAQSGAQLYLGRVEELEDAALRDAISVLLANRQLRNALARAVFSITDGRGVGRVVRCLYRSQMSLRAAADGDCERLFAWRNHPDTRRYFFDPAPIDLSAHRRWFADTLADSTRALLVGLVDGEEVGALRYDFSGDEARVSIYLDPARQGEGHGAALLAVGTQWLRSNRKGLRAIVADVLPANEASVRVFHTAGYRESHRCFRFEFSGAT